MVFSDSGACQFVLSRRAQGKQFLPQLGGHFLEAGGYQPSASGLLDERDVQAIKAGAGHHPKIKSHDLLLVEGQYGGLLFVHPRHQGLAQLHETLLFVASDRVCHR